MDEFFDKKFNLTETLFVLKSKKKRNEEYIKFVIKRGFKFLFKKFKQNNNHFIKGAKILDEEVFYEHYFQKDSELTGTPLKDYFLPGSKIQKKLNPELKSGNLTNFYLKKIFSVTEFRNAFIDYLEN